MVRRRPTLRCSRSRRSSRRSQRSRPERGLSGPAKRGRSTAANGEARSPASRPTTSRVAQPQPTAKRARLRAALPRAGSLNRSERRSALACEPPYHEPGRSTAANGEARSPASRPTTSRVAQPQPTAKRARLRPALPRAGSLNRSQRRSALTCDPPYHEPGRSTAANGEARSRASRPTTSRVAQPQPTAKRARVRAALPRAGSLNRRQRRSALACEPPYHEPGRSTAANGEARSPASRPTTSRVAQPQPTAKRAHLRPALPRAGSLNRSQRRSALTCEPPHHEPGRSTAANGEARSPATRPTTSRVAQPQPTAKRARLRPAPPRAGSLNRSQRRSALTCEPPYHEPGRSTAANGEARSRASRPTTSRAAARRTSLRPATG